LNACIREYNVKTKPTSNREHERMNNPLCQVTIIKNLTGIISKQYILDKDGAVIQLGDAGVMSEGNYWVVGLNSVAELHARFSPLALSPEHGVVLGVPKTEVDGTTPAAIAGRIVSRKQAEWLTAEGRQGCCTRTLDCMGWRRDDVDGAVVLGLDADGVPAACVTTRTLDALVRATAPMLAGVQIYWRPSGSALLMVGGRVVRPFKAHGFMIIPRASQARAIAAALKDILATAGVTLDTSVVSPEHWMFVAPAVYGAGISQAEVEPFLGGQHVMLSEAAADMLADMGTPVQVAEIAPTIEAVAVEAGEMTEVDRLRYASILRLKMRDIDAFAAMAPGDRHNAMNRLVVKCAPYVAAGLLDAEALRDLVWDASRRNGYAADVGRSTWEREFDKSLTEGMDIGELQSLRSVVKASEVFGKKGTSIDVASAPKVLGGARPGVDQAAQVEPVGQVDAAAVVRDWHARVCAGGRDMPDWQAMGTPEGAEAFEGLSWKGLVVFKRAVLAEQKRLAKAAARARFAGSAGAIIEGMNAKYAFIHDRGGKTLVMWTSDEGVVKFKSVHDFENMERNHNLVIDENRVSYGKLWLDHPGRREYDGVVFDPTEECGSEYYNMWQGFAITPSKGNWSLIERHIFEVLSGSNAECYEFIMKCFAHLVQFPGVPLEVCLVFRGRPGCGKGVILRLIKRLFGKFGLHITNPKQLTGRFNAHLETCCFLFADEVCGSDDKESEKQIMAYITEPTIPIEPKGLNLFEVPNRMTITMATNEDWAVPVAKGDRRFAVFDAADTYVKNVNYFDNLYECIETSGGAAAFMEALLSIDLTGWKARSHVPDTEARREQAELSLGPIDAWWLCILESGELPGVGTAPGETKFSALLDDASKQAERRLQPRAFSKTLRGYGGQDRMLSSGLKVWEFPALNQCRAVWDGIHGARNWEGEAAWPTVLGCAPKAGLTLVKD
jgi:hypothetical protein